MSNTSRAADAALLNKRSYRRGLTFGLAVAELLVLLTFLLLLLLIIPHAATQPKEGPTEPPARAREPGAPAGESREEIARVQEENAALRESLSQDKQELVEKIRQQTIVIERLAKKKGIDPSCWYKTDETGKQNQVYLFDVNIYDEDMEIKDLEPPPQYVEEKARLPLAGFPFGRRISDRRFLRVTQPVYEYAKSGKLRPYPCVFYVRIRDRTAAAAKKRYQQVTEQVIGRHFYRYRSRTP